MHIRLVALVVVLWLVPWESRVAGQVPADPGPSGANCTASLTHYFAGAYVSAAKRTTAVLSLVNPASTRRSIVVTLLRPSGQKPIALNVPIGPGLPADVKLHSWITNGTFAVKVACQGFCAATLAIRDGNTPVFAPQAAQHWGCLEQEPS